MNHIKTEITKQLLTKNGRLNSAILRRDWFKSSKLYYQINTMINFTDNISEKIYCIMNDILNKPTCPTCNKLLKFKMYKHGYPKTCKSISCIRSNNSWSSCSQTKKSNHRKNKSSLIKAFNENSYILISRKNVLDFISKRVKETNNGVNGRFVYNLESIDMLCSIIFYTKDIVPITQGTKWSERFYLIYNNITIPNCVICGKPSKYVNFIKGYQATCSSKCSNNGYSQSRRVESHFIEIKPYIEDQNITILSSPKRGLNSSHFKLKCNVCENIFNCNLQNGRWQNIYCSNCHTSKPQKEIKEFLLKFTDNVLENDRKVLNGKELDIYLPDYNFAIEVDGIYWHSELKGKKRNYHINKTNECKNNGIQLIHIFETEWNNNKDIVKSILSTKLNKNVEKIYARKSIVKEIDTKTKREFLNKNHLQGNGKSKYKLGLFYNDELVSVMTFGKRKITKNDPEYEIIRFASKLNTNVIGGASKLLKYFERTYKPSKLITYSDKRYSTSNNFYQQLGFTFSHESKPNYWYFKDSNVLLSRVNFQKHKLKNKLESFNKTLSEWKNMKNNGYNRIWDCGNYVFYKHYK